MIGIGFTANTIAGLTNGAGQAEANHQRHWGARWQYFQPEEIAMILQVHKDLGLTTNIKAEKLWGMSQLVQHDAHACASEQGNRR